MGIQGLLPMLKEISVHGHISDFKGKRLAVDAYVWLHKGAFGCAEQLVKGQKTTKFVDYAMHRVRLLRHFGITPYIVFDGGPLPAKKGTEVSRAKSRADSLAKAQSLESQGRMTEARDCYTKCLDITPEMAFQLIKALRAEGVEYVVAPYEADAQLCFLEREGYVDGIITEDSDLLVFGCRQVIFKLDNNGQCVSINRDHFQTLVEFPMHGWTDLQFRRMAMLSGCDYLPSIPGIGIKTAHKMLRRYKTVEKLLQSIRMDGSHNVPADYNALFSQAELAFIFQRVYNPALNRLVPLNDFPEGGLKEEDQKWVGLDVDILIARGMATGDVHPETRVPIEDLWPDYKPQSRNPTRSSASSGILQPAKVTAGPMDAFVKRTRSEPLPKPIGTASSGPSRLSDIKLFSQSQPETQATEGPVVKRSKFFGGKKSAAKELEEAVAAIKEDIVWQNSDEPDVETQLQESAQALPPSSPAPFIETLLSPQISPLRRSSPARSDDAHHLTSPPISRCSTPASSPSAEARRDRDDCFSPSPSPKRSIKQKTERPAKRQRTISSGSPTPSIKVDARAAMVEETQEEDFPDLIAETPINLATARTTSRLALASSHSSPSTRLSTKAMVGTSSDGIDEEVVTPILNLNRFRRNDSKPRIAEIRSKPVEEDVFDHQEPEPTSFAIDSVEADGLDDVEDPDESDGEDARLLKQKEEEQKRTKVIADGWRKKFAFNDTVAFPKPRSTRSSRPTDENGYPRDMVLSPPRKALKAKEINVETTERLPSKPLPRRIVVSEKTPIPDHTTPRLFKLDRPDMARRSSEKPTRVEKVKVQDEAMRTPVRSPLSSHDPGKMIFSSLEKFRYTGKKLNTSAD